MSEHRPYKIVAPWYRWQRQVLEEKSARSPRETRPTFQKFNRADFVRGFLSDPQRSLKFDRTVDEVFTTQLVPAPLISSGSLISKAVTLYRPKDASGNVSPQLAKLLPTGMRKLFLDTHRRHYVIVCELHCDAPGFPSANFDDVCQAGFVVRRRLLRYPASASSSALAILKRIVSVQARIADLDETTPLKPAQAKKRAAMVAALKQSGKFADERASLLLELGGLRTELKKWRDDNGVAQVSEGWVASEFERIGAWQVVEETPETLAEASFPLYQLRDNPTLEKHDARGRAIFFGVLPTSSLDTEARGAARFDSDHVYEVRCFVRRHKPECSRAETVPDCHGPLFWSESSESYRLAPQFDLLGTANNPVTIQMPDLAELSAQANQLPFGSLSPVRVVQPQTLTPKSNGKALVSGVFGQAGAVCFFAIPLITIVALFVLQLFLPIVVFLFGLWFLLAFKFCIPPSLSIDAGLQLELDTMGRLGLDVDADISASVSARIQAEIGFTFTTKQVNDGLRVELSNNISETLGIDASQIDLTPFANSPLVGLHRAFAEEKALPSSVDSASGVGPDLRFGLEYEARVEAPMVAS